MWFHFYFSCTIQDVDKPVSLCFFLSHMGLVQFMSSSGFLNFLFYIRESRWFLTLCFLGVSVSIEAYPSIPLPHWSMWSKCITDEESWGDDQLPAPATIAKTLHRSVNSTFLVQEQLTGGLWGMVFRMNMFFFFFHVIIHCHYDA